jgi:hypothetical protein
VKRSRELQNNGATGELGRHMTPNKLVFPRRFTFVTPSILNEAYDKAIELFDVETHLAEKESGWKKEHLFLWWQNLRSTVSITSMD